MILCRGMSMKELILYMDNIEILPAKNRQLHKRSYMTDCQKEICFFGMENEAFATDFGEVVAVFEIQNARKGWGVYDWTYGGEFVKDEYRLPSYNKNDAKLLFWYFTEPCTYDSETDRRLTEMFGPYWYGVKDEDRCNIQWCTE